MEGQPPRELFAESRGADQWIRAFALLGACSSDLTLSVAATADGGGSTLMRKAAAAATGAATAAAVGSPGGSDGGSAAAAAAVARVVVGVPCLDEYGFRLEEEAAAHDAQRRGRPRRRRRSCGSAARAVDPLAARRYRDGTAD